MTDTFKKAWKEGLQEKNRRQNTLQATFLFIYLFYNELCKCIHMLTLLGYFIEIF